VTADDELVQETFGQRIKRRRRETGLTQRQVAAQLEIDFTYLSKLENDRGSPGHAAPVAASPLAGHSERAQRDTHRTSARGCRPWSGRPRQGRRARRRPAC
jgi:transcriptional regulator with XRE-family HTH domain